MGRGYLLELLRFIWTFKKKYLSTLDQNYHTLKIMTMGRGYLPGLLRFILTFKKKYLSTSDQNYHILKGVSVKTKVVIRN